MNSELRTFAVPDLRYLPAADGNPTRIQARALIYDAVSEDMGGWREVFSEGSVELDPDLRMLYDHNTSNVIGRLSAGTLDAMDDGSGIVATGYPPDTGWARDLLVSMERGDINQMSFRFLALEDDIVWVPSETADGGGYVLRTVTRAKVSEISVVAIPAYPQTVALARASVSGELRKRVLAALPTSLAHQRAELREGRVLSTATMQALSDINEGFESCIDQMTDLNEQLEAVLATDPNWSDDNDDDADAGDAGARAKRSSKDNVGGGGSPTAPSSAGSAPPVPSSGSIYLPGLGLRNVKQEASDATD